MYLPTKDTLLKGSANDLFDNVYAIFFFFSIFFFFFFIKAYIVGTHLNCINKLMQFEWVPTTYVSIDKKYSGSNLKTTELLNSVLIGVCAVIRTNTVVGIFIFISKEFFMLSWARKNLQLLVILDLLAGKISFSAELSTKHVCSIWSSDCIYYPQIHSFFFFFFFWKMAFSLLKLHFCNPNWQQHCLAWKNTLLIVFFYIIFIYFFFLLFFCSRINTKLTSPLLFTLLHPWVA